jgi:Uma2 family endonuclease
MTTDTLPTPPLAAGQKLTRCEFERRWAARPYLKRAELIDGVVHMAAAVRLQHHGVPHGAVTTWLGVYGAATPGVQLAVEASVRLEGDNEPQPDALLFIEPDCGGQVELSADDYIEGGPDLVVEVAASSEDQDLGPKQRLYHSAGVREYLVWRVEAGVVEWYVRRSEGFEALPADANGLLHSMVFPGLVLDPAALVRFDLANVLAILQQGLAGPEHAVFVAHLAAVRASQPGA